MTEADHGPGVRLPPPVLVGGVLALAWFAHLFFPVLLGPPLPDYGVLVIFLGVALIGWALLALVKAGNDPRPDKPDAAIVTTGPFRFSRNPIYLGFLVVVLGFALACAAGLPFGAGSAGGDEGRSLPEHTFWRRL